MHEFIDCADACLGYGIMGYDMHDFGDPVAGGGVWRQEQLEDGMQLCRVADDGNGYMRVEEEGKSAEAHVDGEKHGHKNCVDVDGDKISKLCYPETAAEDHDCLLEALPKMSGKKGTHYIKSVTMALKMRELQLAANEIMLKDPDEATTRFQYPMTDLQTPLSSTIEPALRLRGGGDDRKAKRARRHAEDHGNTRGERHHNSRENRHAQFADNGEYYQAEEWRDHRRQQTPSNHDFRHGDDMAGFRQYVPVQFDREDPFQPQFFGFNPLRGQSTSNREWEQTHGHHTRHHQRYENTGPTRNINSTGPFFVSHHSHSGRQNWTHAEPRGAMFGVPSADSNYGGRRVVGYEFFPLGFGGVELPHPLHPSYDRGARRSTSPPSRRPHRPPHSPARNGTKTRTDHTEHSTDSEGSTESEEWQGRYDSDDSYYSFESDFNYSAEPLNPVEDPPPDHYATLDVTPECSAKEIADAAKKMRVKTHPDKLKKEGMPDEEKAKIDEDAAKVGQAADILSDPAQRMEYDLLVGQWRSSRSRRARH